MSKLNVIFWQIAYGNSTVAAFYFVHLANHSKKPVEKIQKTGPFF